MLQCTGILLAAGQGKRAGGPKALKLVEGHLWWRCQVEAMRLAVCQVVAVLHPDAWPDAAVCPDGVQACAGDPVAEQLASLQQAIAIAVQFAPKLPVLVLPVDCPWPGVQVAKLLTSAADDRCTAVRPVVSIDHFLRGGHPLLLTPRSFAPLLALNERTDRLDRWLALQPKGALLNIETADRRVLANRNDQADWA